MHLVTVVKHEERQVVSETYYTQGRILCGVFLLKVCSWRSPKKRRGLQKQSHFSTLSPCFRPQISSILVTGYLVLRSSLASDFVKKLLVVDPDQRMTAPQALEHPWIKNHENACSDCIDEAMVSERRIQGNSELSGCWGWPYAFWRVGSYKLSCNTKLNFIVLEREVSHHCCFRLDL